MGEVREAIDVLDSNLVALLAKRFASIDRAADLKPRAGLPPRTVDRVQQVVDQVRALAVTLAIDPDLIEKNWRDLIKAALAREMQLMSYEHTLDRVHHTA